MTSARISSFKKNAENKSTKNGGLDPNFGVKFPYAQAIDLSHLLLWYTLHMYG